MNRAGLNPIEFHIENSHAAISIDLNSDQKN